MAVWLVMKGQVMCLVGSSCSAAVLLEIDLLQNFARSSRACHVLVVPQKRRRCAAYLYVSEDFVASRVVVRSQVLVSVDFWFALVNVEACHQIVASTQTMALYAQILGLAMFRVVTGAAWHLCHRDYANASARY